MTEGVREQVAAVLDAVQLVVLGYLVLVTVTSVALVAIGGVVVGRRLRRSSPDEHDALFANPLTPAVSIVVPAHDEEAVIVASVRSLLALHYPELEVVVVDDGSTDATFARLEEAFDLVPVHRVLSGEVPVIGRPTSVHAARDGRPLVVVRKPATGRRADALNVGITAARHPLVCMVDADSLLEEDALLRVVGPFVDDPVRTVAAGGAVRPVNGARVELGRVVAPRVPASALPAIQVVEYLRSFLFGRTAWSRLGALLVISGAFGVFRRDVLVEVGGVDLDCIGEDAELVTRIHARLRAQGRPYRMVFLAEPVCWTEVPSTLRVLGRQRRRWSRGLAEVLWRHRAMLGSPRYGTVGLLAMPYMLVVELLSPVVEAAGLAVTVLGLATGLVDPALAGLVALVALGYGVLLSLVALAAEELSYHRYPRWRDLGLALAAAVLENLGYRQLHAWWRLQGLMSFVLRRKMGWGVMQRQGFSPDPGGTVQAG
jgi:cellulose synthase/poly-beta-1,6-N-acetylglucosamine synthase-like glycosyltransferase